MITLVLIFCLGQACREERYPDVEPSFCEGARPQFLAAEWLAEHADGWRFEGARCEIIRGIRKS